jgi:hypothetical protein
LPEHQNHIISNRRFLGTVLFQRLRKVGIDFIPFSALRRSCGPELTDAVLSLLAAITTVSTSLPFVHMILSFLAPRPDVSHLPHFVSIIRLTNPLLAMEERRRSQGSEMKVIGLTAPHFRSSFPSIPRTGPTVPMLSSNPAGF